MTPKKGIILDSFWISKKRIILSKWYLKWYLKKVPFSINNTWKRYLFDLSFQKTNYFNQNEKQWDPFLRYHFGFYKKVPFFTLKSRTKVLTRVETPDKFHVGLKFWTSWRGVPTIFKITMLRRHFSKMCLKVDFLEKTIRISI